MSRSKKVILLSDDSDVETTDGDEDDIPTDEDSEGSLADFIDKEDDDQIPASDDEFEEDESEEDPDPDSSEPEGSSDQIVKVKSPTPDPDDGIEISNILPETQKRTRRAPQRFQPKNMQKLLLADVPKEELSDVLNSSDDQEDTSDADISEMSESE